MLQIFFYLLICMLNKNISLKTNQLSSYDLIYKYNLLSSYKIPKIFSTTLNFPIQKFFSDIKKEKNTVSKNIYKKILYFISYFFSSFLFFIKIKKQKLDKKIKKTNVFLQIKLQKRNCIYSFLNLLFIENYMTAKKLLEFSTNKTFIISKEFICINKTLKASFLTDLNAFMFFLYPNLNTKALSLNMCFKFININSLRIKNNLSLIKNFSLFWL